jgi:RsiW-degrading membrane proteinase PrsW (M82 family)
MTYFPLFAALVLLVVAVILSVQQRQESVLSVFFGAVVTLGFGVQEMWAALAPGIASRAQALHVATSIGFTSAAALFARLAIRGFQSSRRTSH